MANNERFTATIEVNSQQAQSRLRELKADVERLKEEQKKALAEGTAESKKRAQQLQKEIDLKNKLYRQEEKHVKGLDAAMQSLSRKTYKELQAQVRALNRLMRDGTVEKGTEEWKALAERVKQCKREMREFETAVTEQQGVWQKFTRFMNDSWASVALILSSVTGLSMTVRKVVSDFADMEEAMADTRKYTGLTDEAVRDLNEDLKRMDTRTPREQLNELAGAAGRLGKTSKKDILEFVEAADMISVALGDDLGDGAVDQIGKLAMAFGEDDRMGLRGAMLATGSAVNELAQNSSAQAGYLVDFTARVAGFGKQLGLTQAQIMGFGAVMDENLLRDEMASTAFGNMLTKMQIDTEKFAKIAGKSVEEFTTLLNTDANQAVLTLADSLRRADPQTMMKMLDDMGLDGARAVGVLSTMADKIDDVRERQRLATEAYAEGTSVVQEYAQMNSTVQAEIDKAKDSFHEVSVELGEKLLPVVKYTISGTSMLVKSLSVLVSWLDKYKTTIVSTGITMGVLIAWKKKDVIWTKLVVFWNEKLVGSLKSIAATIKANPWTAAITAIVALGTAIYDLTRKTEKARTLTDELNEAENNASKDSAAKLKTLKALYDGSQDVNKSTEERIKFIKALRQQFPAYFKDLSDEEILAGRAADAYKRLTDEIVSSSRARAYQAKIDDISQATAELESAIEADQEWLKANEEKYKKSLKDSERPANIAAAASPGAAAADWNERRGFVTVYERMQQRVIKNQETIKENDEKIAKLAQKAVENMPQEKTDRDTERTPATYVTDAERRKQEAERAKQEREQRKQLKEQADAARASWQEQLATEMLAYRQGLTAYTDYMENRHRLTQAYYDELKRIYGEDSNQYKKALLNQERDEQEYYQWQTKRREEQLLQEKLVREHTIRMQYAQQAVVDEDALNEALFQSDVTYLKQKQNLYNKGSREWLELEQQIGQEVRQHQFELEQGWMQRLSQYRQEAGMTDYQRLMEIELRGVESFYGALVSAGRMTQDEYDRIVEHIKRKYAEMAASQTAAGDTRRKASAALDTARKAAGAEQVAAGGDMATGLFAVSQAVSQQRLINEQLKLLYGEDYENNREYQEAKRQLEAETMQQIVAGAQTAYSTISSLVSAASSYSQACSDIEVAKITANYDRQIDAAGNNSKKREKLEKERDKEIAKAKTKANERAMKMELAQAVAQSAMGAISAYSSTMAGAPYPANLVLAPVSAGIALAAGAVQIATIKKQHEAEAAGYYEGGFTGGKRYRREAGVVHEGEFVANHQAVNNRQLMPVFTLIDQAQRSNRVGSLRAEDVTSVMGGQAAAQVVAPIVNVQSDNSELQAGLENLGEVVDTLRQRLDDGIEAYTVMDGPNGLYKSLRKYERLISKK